MAKKKIEWLTEQEVQAAAGKSPLAAAECTVEHWRQLVTASRLELRRAYKKDLANVRGDHCAFCCRYHTLFSCGRCPVAKRYATRCGGEFLWGVASAQFDDVVSGSISAFPRWRKVAKKVLAQLEEIAEELRAKSRKRKRESKDA